MQQLSLQTQSMSLELVDLTSFFGLLIFHHVERCKSGEKQGKYIEMWLFDHPSNILTLNDSITFNIKLLCYFFSRCSLT